MRERSRALVAPLLFELAAVGHPVERVWDLVETKEKYPAAIPVLVQWIPRVADDPAAADWVLRAIGKPWAKEAVPGLLEQFTVDNYDEHLRWLIADALGRLWRYVPTEALAALASDPRWDGPSREMLLQALGKQARTKEQARAAVVAAVSDPIIGGHALQWIAKHDLPVDRKLIEPFLTDDRPCARADAKKIINRTA